MSFKLKPTRRDIVKLEKEDVARLEKGVLLY